MGNDIKVELYDGTTWRTATTTANQNGPYNLLLDDPNIFIATNTAKVRITDGSDTDVVSESASAFTVRPLLTVDSPVANASWVVDELTRDITWTKKGNNVADVKIEYVADGTFNGDEVVIYATTANDGTQRWAVPQGAAAGACSPAGGIPDAITSSASAKVRITSLPAGDPWVVTALSSGFKIKGQLTMMTPNDATPVKWRIGGNNTISWQNTHGTINTAKLYYSQAGDGGPWSILRNAGCGPCDPQLRLGDSERLPDR
jgi:hypothetical protein